MDLNIKDWKLFNVSRTEFQSGLMRFEQCKCGCAGDLESGDDINYIGAKKADNGVMNRVALVPNLVSKGNGIMIICDGQGSVGYANYMRDDFIGSTTTSVGYDEAINETIAMFIVTCLDLDRYKYSYGRKYRPSMNDALIKLPIQHYNDGKPIIDATKKYSKEGYVPDWKFMEEYINSLHSKPITTTIGKDNILDLDIDKWKEFFLKDLFYCQMGNGIDAGVTTSNNPVYNYVSRDSKGNGVVNYVDVVVNVDKKGKEKEEEPFEAGTMTLALGGSYLGSCFVQKLPYYTAQNVSVLREKEPLSIKTKLFITTLIRNECKYKYVAFGIELNAHYKTDFSIKLPIQYDVEGNPIIDPKHKYSDEGYIPDWQFMDDYISSLPYSDRIIESAGD